MDVLEAIMKIFADIFEMNNIPGPTADLILGLVSGFVQGIMALVETIQKVFDALGAL